MKFNVFIKKPLKTQGLFFYENWDGQKIFKIYFISSTIIDLAGT